MHKPLRIAVVGCGVGGLAAAAMLHDGGHDVQLYEKFDAPQPVGSGLLLQPTGLACLARLGLDDAAIQVGGQINRIYGEAARSRVIFDVAYNKLAPHYFGLGIHRASLFDILFKSVADRGLKVNTGADIEAIERHGSAYYLKDTRGRDFDPVDLVIDASGRHSVLRRYADICFNKPYPFGAIWGVVNDPKQNFGKDLLQQRYEGAHIMCGMLAIGRAPPSKTRDSDEEKCAFFWSLPPNGYQEFLDTELPVWKNDVLRIWPELESFMCQFRSHDDLIYAQYNDVVLRSWHSDGIAFIGDAAHSMSPQLGQGANLALADAVILSQLLNSEPDMQTALVRYSKVRRNPILFYQYASRWLTPFFQSHSRVAGWVRDKSFRLMGQMPYIKNEMLHTLAGTKAGLFTHCDPGNWHSRYHLRKN